MYSLDTLIRLQSRCCRADVSNRDVHALFQHETIALAVTAIPKNSPYPRGGRRARKLILFPIVQPDTDGNHSGTA